MTQKKKWKKREKEKKNEKGKKEFKKRRNVETEKELERGNGKENQKEKPGNVNAMKRKDMTEEGLEVVQDHHHLQELHDEQGQGHGHGTGQC